MYVIFEGGEGTGKSSTMQLVSERLPHVDAQLTYHPGSTPLGAHIRQLVKYPQTIDPQIQMDPLSRQVLYMADTINFLEMILKPALNNQQSVFADRSTFISGLVYATADQVDNWEILRLLQLVDPPRADKLYIFDCPYEVSRQRVNDQSRNDQTEGDHYDNQASEFHKKILNIYANLECYSPDFAMMVSRVVALENIVHIDASLPQDQIVDIIVDDLQAVASAEGNC
jgi:dTMP kinase